MRQITWDQIRAYIRVHGHFTAEVGETRIEITDEHQSLVRACFVNLDFTLFLHRDKIDKWSEYMLRDVMNPDLTTLEVRHDLMETRDLSHGQRKAALDRALNFSMQCEMDEEAKEPLRGSPGLPPCSRCGVKTVRSEEQEAACSCGSPRCEYPGSWNCRGVE